MSRPKRLVKVRCPHCGKLAPTLLLGRCPRCLSIANALASDWAIDNALVRRLVRHEGSRLALYVRQDTSGWSVHAIESLAEDRQSICRVTHRPLLPDAMAAGEAFGRRWLEGAPGTAIATYVEKPADGARG